MKWVIRNGNKERKFNSCEEVGNYLGYSRGYVSQRYRMGLKLEGYTIEKIQPKEKRTWKKYSQAELIRRMEELEMICENMQYQISELKEKEERRAYW